MDREWSVTFSPRDRGRVSPLLALVGLVLLGLGIAVLWVPAIRSEWWLYVVVLPVAALVLWLGRIFLGTWWRAALGTTCIAIGHQRLEWRHGRWGRVRTLALGDIRDVAVTDVLGPDVCSELLLTTADNRTHQILAFRQLTPAILDVVERLQQARGSGVDESEHDR